MRISSITKNAGKACNNRLYRHIRTFEKIIKNYFVISEKSAVTFLQVVPCMFYFLCKNSGIHHALCPNPGKFCPKSAVKAAFEKKCGKSRLMTLKKEGAAHSQCPRPLKNSTRENAMPERPQTLRHYSIKKYFSFQLTYAAMPMVPSSGSSPS